MSAPAPSAVFEAAVWEAIAAGRAHDARRVGALDPKAASEINAAVRRAWELAYNAGYDAGCDASDSAALPLGGDIS
jgi:hypothetical protein